MKVVGKKALAIAFGEVEPGQVFRTTDDLGYMMKIEEIQTYDADEDEQVWRNAVTLLNGSLTSILDAELVELVKNCEFIVY